MTRSGEHRVRWAAVGAAVAVALGVGIIPVAQAVVGSGERSVFVPIVPCRLLDTRGGSNTVGSRDTPLGPAESYEVVARGSSGNCTLPSDATAIATNSTVTGGTAASFLTVYPADKPRPQASNLNWTAGQSATPNQVTVGLSSSGRIRLYNDRGSVNVIIDVVGYYAHHHHDDRYYTKAQHDALPSSALIAGGGVLSDGAASPQVPAIGTWTASQTGTGRYSVVLHSPRITCDPVAVPIVQAVGFGVDVRLEPFLVGACVDNIRPLTARFITVNAAGTDFDGFFMFTAYLPG